MTRENYHRRVESSETQQQPNVEISELAQNKLEKWGLTPDQIESLKLFSSQFRYDLCVDKVNQLTKKDAEVFQKKGIDTANFPNFYSIQDNKGPCGSIARQWILRINEEKLINNLNQNLTDGKKIVTCFYTGTSRTHFTEKNSTHIWNGLALIDKDGNIEDEIYVDSSFRLVMTKNESGYKQKTAKFDLDQIHTSKNAPVNIGWVNLTEANWEGSIPGLLVLGISSNYEVTFSLGFVRDVNKGEIVPIICTADANEKADYFLFGANGKILFTNDNFSSEIINEIRQLLIQAKSINFVNKPPTKTEDHWKKKKKWSLF